MDSSCRERVREMFAYHATDGTLDSRAFSHLTQEGLACAFLDVKPTPAVRGDIRCACARQALPGADSALFARLFQFFDYDQQGQLNEEQLISGLDQFFFGNWEEKMAGLFHLTDLDDDGKVNALEMEDFLQEFRELYYTMAMSVFRMRHTKLVSCSELQKRFEFVQEQLDTKTVIVSTECAELLDKLDLDRDLHVDLEEWTKAEFALPVMFAQLLGFFMGIADPMRKGGPQGQFYNMEDLSIEPIVEPEPELVVPPPPSPPRRFTLDDLRKSSSFVGAIEAVTVKSQ